MFFLYFFLFISRHLVITSSFSIMIESSKQVAVQTFQNDQNNINMQNLIIIICWDKIDSKQVNLYVRQIFQMYHVNKIRDHDLYKTILHDLFELKQKHWDVLISRTWNVVNIVCYTQEYWISHSRRKETRAKLMFQTIKTSFYQN